MPRNATAKVTRAARKPTPKVTKGATSAGATSAAAPSFLTLGPGWAYQDAGNPIASVVIDGVLAHLTLRVKVKTAGTASWDKLASIAAYQNHPQAGQGRLPCAVYDASAGKWYMALARVSGAGFVSVEAIGATADGSLASPFAIGVDDEVHVNVTYYNM
jgi:hypothetical protein